MDGARITGIAAFYDEINRVFMAEEDWALGQSLDALDDMLYGGYGAIAGAQRVVLTWSDRAASRKALGTDATLEFLRRRLAERPRFNGGAVSDQIAALERGQGKTYFDIVMEVFAGHPTIEIVDP